MPKWPTRLAEDPNEFIFAKADPDTAPTLKVTTWSKLFGSGGNVSVEAYQGDDRYRLASIDINSDRSVLDERKHLDQLVKEWNKDAAENWRNLILGCRAQIVEYHRKEIKRHRKELREAERGVFK